MPREGGKRSSSLQRDESQESLLFPAQRETRSSAPITVGMTSFMTSRNPRNPPPLESVQHTLASLPCQTIKVRLPWAPFTQDAEHLATRARKLWNTLQHRLQATSKGLQQICLRVLCEWGLTKRRTKIVMGGGVAFTVFRHCFLFPMQSGLM